MVKIEKIHLFILITVSYRFISMISTIPDERHVLLDKLHLTRDFRHHSTFEGQLNALKKDIYVSIIYIDDLVDVLRAKEKQLRL